MNLQEAKDNLYKELVKKVPVKCPCCESVVQIYKRSLNYNMIIAMCLMYKNGADTSFIHVQDVLAKKENVRATSLDYIQLKRWNFIEENTLKSGEYKITNIGIMFLTNKTVVPSYCFVYNNETIKWTTKMVSISDVLKNKFDLNSVLNKE